MQEYQDESESDLEADLIEQLPLDLDDVDAGDATIDSVNDDDPIPEPEKPVIVPELVPAISQVDIPASTGLVQTGDDMGTVIVVLLVIIGLVVIWLLTGEHSPLKSRSRFYFGGSRMVRVIVTVAVLLVISLVLKAFGLI